MRKLKRKRFFTIMKKELEEVTERIMDIARQHQFAYLVCVPFYLFSAIVSGQAKRAVRYRDGVGSGGL